MLERRIKATSLSHDILFKAVDSDQKNAPRVCLPIETRIAESTITSWEQSPPKRNGWVSAFESDLRWSMAWATFVGRNQDAEFILDRVGSEQYDMTRHKWLIDQNGTKKMTVHFITPKEPCNHCWPSCVYAEFPDARAVYRCSSHCYLKYTTGGFFWADRLRLNTVLLQQRMVDDRATHIFKSRHFQNIYTNATRSYNVRASIKRTASSRSCNLADVLHVAWCQE